jgi:hypothetical protein
MFNDIFANLIQKFFPLVEGWMFAEELMFQDLAQNPIKVSLNVKCEMRNFAKSYLDSGKKIPNISRPVTR